METSDIVFFFFFKQKTAYEIVDCDWSSDVCSSDLAKEIVISAPHFKRDSSNEKPVSSYRLYTAGSPERSEERRVGKECRTRWSRYHLKKKDRRTLVKFSTTYL